MRSRLLESGRFYSSRIRKSENEIEETRKNLSYVSATGGCVSLGAAQLCFETSFRRFRRTILEGSRFLPARHILLGAFSRASGDTKLYHPRWRRGECWMRDALLGTQHNGLTCKSRQRPTLSWQYHETEEDRDAQDRVGRPSAVTARRPAQTARWPEWPEDRAARRNELRRADRVSPEASEHALQREAWQRRRVRPHERPSSTLPRGNLSLTSVKRAEIC
jgi:hypothetical protein